jgi:hypothetical protein
MMGAPVFERVGETDLHGILRSPVLAGLTQFAAPMFRLP